MKTQHGRGLTYVVVADGTRARVFTASGAGTLSPLREMTHLEGRLHVSELVSDHQGESRSDGSPARHGHSPHTDVHDAEAERFAARIARDLDDARASGALHDVILAMAPRLLGQVRAALSHATSQRVVLAIAERLIDLDVDVLEARVKYAGGMRPAL